METKPNDETRLISGLRERRLFRLAEYHCNNLLAQPNLSPADSATYAIELIKTQTARAILSPLPQRDSFWESANQTSAKFLSDYPNHPRQLLVEVQIALTHLSHGQLLRQELAAEMVSESARETALTELRTANSMFNEVQRTITKKIPEQRGRTLTEGELSAAELMALNNQVRFQSALTNMNRAQLYPAEDRLNRIDALNNVLQSLTDVQRETSAGQPLWWDNQVLQIECMRLLERLDDSQAVVERLRAAVTETEPAPQSLLEQELRLALDRGDSEAAMKGLRETEIIEGRAPQLDLARLAVALDFSLRGTGNKKTEWLNKAANLARTIENEHGAYWGRRAKLVLIGNSGVDGNPSTDIAGSHQTNDPARLNPNENAATSAELDLLIGLAEQAERKQRFDDAVKAYDRAAQTATQLNARPQAFALSVRASQALEKLQQHELAANRLIDLAIKNSDYRLADAAHLRGCWNWAQIMGSDPARQQRFTDLLTDQLQRWPAGDSAPQAHVWLGAQMQTARHWEAAFENYLAVPAKNALFGDAINRAVSCAHRRLDEMSDGSPETFRSVANTITAELKQTIAPTELAAATNRQAWLAFTEFGILHGTIAPAESYAALESILAFGDDDATSSRARAWLFSQSAIDAAKSTTTQDLLATISADKDQLAIADQGIQATFQHHASLVSTQSQEWRLKLIEAALSGSVKLDERETTIWLYRKSDALARLKKNDEALAVLLELEKKLPSDAGIQLRIARLLSQVYAGGELEAPLTKWRQLAIQLKPHTDSWYEAKYNVALMLDQSGKSDEAKKLLEYLQAIPPGWTNSKLRTEFEILLKKVSK